MKLFTKVNEFNTLDINFTVEYLSLLEDIDTNNYWIIQPLISINVDIK